MKEMSFEQDFKDLKEKLQNCGTNQRYNKRAAKKSWLANEHDQE